MFRVDDIVEQCIQTKSIGKYSRGKVIRVWLAYDPMQTKNAYEVEFTDPQGQKLYRLRYENEIVPLHSATTQAVLSAFQPQPMTTPNKGSMTGISPAYARGDKVLVDDAGSMYYGQVGEVIGVSVLPYAIVYDLNITAYGKTMPVMFEEQHLKAMKATSMYAQSPWAQSIDKLTPDKVTTIKKECKHEWKERTLFISVEEYCIHCPAFRLKKAV